MITKSWYKNINSIFEILTRNRIRQIESFEYSISDSLSSV